MPSDSHRHCDMCIFLGYIIFFHDIYGVRDTTGYKFFFGDISGSISFL